MTNWIKACSADMDCEEVSRFDHGARTFAIYRVEDGSFHCSDGLCTHEAVHLCDGFVEGNSIECPKHSGAFDIRTGEAERLPVCTDLKIYPVKVESNFVYIDIA